MTNVYRGLMIAGICAWLAALVNYLFPVIGDQLIPRIINCDGIKEMAQNAQTSNAFSLSFIIAGIVLLGLAGAMRFLYRGGLRNSLWSEKQFIIIIILARLAFGAIGMALIHYAPFCDDLDYYGYAANLTAGEDVRTDRGVSTAYRAIGYPFILSLFFKLFGLHVWVGQIVNLLMAAGILPLVYFSCKEMFGPRTAREAAWILLFTPSMVFYAVPLFSDIAYTFFFLAIILLALLKPTAIKIIMLGLAYGMAILVRPIFVLFPICIVIYWFLRQESWRRILLHGMIVITIGELILLPWQIRNYYVFHKFVLCSTMGGIHLWMGNYDGANGEIAGYTSFISPTETLAISSLNEAELDSYAFGRGLDYFFSHPFKAISVWPRKALVILWKDSRSVIYAMGGHLTGVSSRTLLVVMIVTEAYYILLLFLFAYGLWRLWRNEKISSRAWLLGSGVAYVVGIYLMFIADPRYHMPIIPLLAIIASTTAKLDQPTAFNRSE